MSGDVPTMRDLIRARFPEFKEAWVMHRAKYDERILELIESAIAFGHYDELTSIGQYEAVADLIWSILVLSKSNDYYVVTIFDPLELFWDPVIAKEYGPLDIGGEKLHNLRLDSMSRV